MEFSPNTCRWGPAWQKGGNAAAGIGYRYPLLIVLARKSREFEWIYSFQVTVSGHLRIIHKQFCHRSWRVRWQRPARHTGGSYSPEWKYRQLSFQTASQCSPLEEKQKHISNWELAGREGSLTVQAKISCHLKNVTTSSTILDMCGLHVTSTRAVLSSEAFRWDFYINSHELFWSRARHWSKT